MANIGNEIVDKKNMLDRLKSIVYEKDMDRDKLLAKSSYVTTNKSKGKNCMNLG